MYKLDAVKEYEKKVKNQVKFIQYCQSGDLNKAKKMLSKNTYLVIDEDMLADACYDDHFELAQWMVSINPELKNPCDRAFLSSCRRGHLEIAKWVFSLNPDLKDDEFPFTLACFYGYLDVAKWLLTVIPSIDPTNDENDDVYDDLFGVACGSKKKHIAEWIMTLKPYRYILSLNPDGTIFSHMIRPLKEIRWLKRRIPLLAYNSKAYNSKAYNVFKMLNEDVLREICLFV